SNTRRVGPDHRVHALGQGPANRIQIFNDARTRPVDIGTVLKNDVNKRFPEHRFAPDKFHFRRGDKDRGNRICDLVFNQVGRATLPIGVNDDLHVAQVWNRVERRVEQSINTGGDCENREDEDEELVPRTGGDDTLYQCIAWWRLTGVRVYHGLTGDSLGEG